MTKPEPITLPPKLVEAQARLTNGDALAPGHINTLARHFMTTDDMDGYCRFLAGIEPALRRHFLENGSDPSFMRATGKVAGAINVFRKLHYKSFCGTVPAFEKIYVRRWPDLKRLKWVYRNLWGKLPFQMPRLIEVIDGKQYSVAIFAFERFEPVSVEELITTALAMNKFSIGHPITAFDHVHPSLKRMPALYKTRRKTLIHNLGSAGISDADLIRLEAQVMTAEPVFNHGDLHRFNVGRNGIIYDWDCGCFAPAAHDLGRMLAALRTFRFVSGLKDFVRNRLGRDTCRDEEEQARIMFFYMVYAAKQRLTEADGEQIMTLGKIFNDIQTTLLDA